MPPPKKSRFVWSPSTGRYKDARGRFITQRTIQNVYRRGIVGSENRVRALGVALRDDKITLEQFTEEMRVEVKSVHLNNAALARGGYGQLSQSDYGKLGNILKYHYTALDNYVQELYAADKPVVNMGRLMLYAKSGRNTYNLFQRLAMADADLTEERSVLHPADHCNECIEQAGFGWQPLGTLVPIGDRECLGNCQCEMRYR